MALDLYLSEGSVVALGRIKLGLVFTGVETSYSGSFKAVFKLIICLGYLEFKPNAGFAVCLRPMEPGAMKKLYFKSNLC